MELGAVRHANGRVFPCGLLERAGLTDEKKGGCEFGLEGADRAWPCKSKYPGRISYARISRDEGMGSPMFDRLQIRRDLTPDHGYPLRAIVRGITCMSVGQWLTDDRCDTRLSGLLADSDYAIGMIPRGTLSPPLARDET